MPAYAGIKSKQSTCLQVQPAIDRAIGIQNHGGHVNVNGREVEVKRSVQGAAITLDLKSGKHEAQVGGSASCGKGNMSIVRSKLHL